MSRRCLTTCNLLNSYPGFPNLAYIFYGFLTCSHIGGHMYSGKEMDMCCLDHNPEEWLMTIVILTKSDEQTPLFNWLT